MEQFGWAAEGLLNEIVLDLACARIQADETGWFRYARKERPLCCGAEARRLVR